LLRRSSVGKIPKHTCRNAGELGKLNETFASWWIDPD